MNLHDVLLKKAHQQELAHFYIVETSATHDAFGVLVKFVHEFIQDYYQKVEGHKQSLAHLMDHPDVFVIGNLTLDDDSTEKFFKVEEAETLNRFFEFKSVQALRKFAVITEGHRVNPTVANKWLKLLEEPQGLSTIFLLNPKRRELLPTIHSRAIHLRLPVKNASPDLAPWNEFLKDVKAMRLAEFLEKHARSEVDLNTRIDQLLAWEAEKNDNAKSKEALKQWLITLQEMDTFNQPNATKWSLFYSWLQHTST
jgi:hypothetical protein